MKINGVESYVEFWRGLSRENSVKFLAETLSDFSCSQAEATHHILNCVRIHDLRGTVDGRGGFFTAANSQFLDRSEIDRLRHKSTAPNMYQN